MLLEKPLLWTLQLEVVNKVLKETILKVSYGEKELVIKGVGSITTAGFIAEIGGKRCFDSPKQIQKKTGKFVSGNDTVTCKKRRISNNL